MKKLLLGGAFKTRRRPCEICANFCLKFYWRMTSVASDSKLSLGAAGRSAALDRGKKGKKLQSGPTKHTAPL